MVRTYTLWRICLQIPRGAKVFSQGSLTGSHEVLGDLVQVLGEL